MPSGKAKRRSKTLWFNGLALIAGLITVALAEPLVKQHSQAVLWLSLVVALVNFVLRFSTSQPLLAVAFALCLATPAHAQQCVNGICQPPHISQRPFGPLPGPAPGAREVGPGFQSPSGQGGSASVSQQQAHPASCRVRVPDASGRGMSAGSGVLIAASDTAGLVLTNNHVVADGAARASCVFPNGQSLEGTVIVVDRVWDCAAIQISRPSGIEPAELAPDWPRIGETLTACGYGPDGVFRAASGQVAAYNGPPGRNEAKWLSIRTAIRSGDSGGPIFNAQGQVAGINWGCDGVHTSGVYQGHLMSLVEYAKPRCNPPWGQPSQPQPPAIAIPKTPEPAKPVPSAPNPPSNAGSGCQCDPSIVSRIEKLERLAVMLGDLAKNPPPGPPGPAGPKGEQGPRGPAGANGRDGKPCDPPATGVDAAELERQVKAIVAGKLRIVVERTK